MHAAIHRGRVSMAIRVNGELQPIAGELPPDAVFPIYSITKTLTAICVLRLAEAGTLQLAAPVRSLLPEIDLPESITLMHLLRHTGGLRDYGGTPAYHDAVRAHPSEPWTRERYLDAVLPAGLLFPPGKGWSYSNVGYMLIVDAMERLTRQTFARVVDQFISVPFGLTNTFTLDRVADMQRCVPGFGTDVSPDRAVRDIREVYHPGWCAPRVVASTTAEVTRVFDGLLAGQLLEPSSLTQMLTLVPLPADAGAPPSIATGLGVYADAASHRGRNYHHGGGGPGYSTSATIYPDTPRGRVAIAVFIDSSDGPEARETESQWLAQVLD